jgi:hypothetical protein
MDLQDCLDHYEATGDTLFEIQQYNQSETRGHTMRIRPDGTYQFYDADGQPLNDSDPLWVELEHSNDWYRW